jgi:carboxy-cis,cis-muconate cyclase
VLFSVPSSENKLSPKYLIAATRSYSLTTTGYVSAFALDATTGAIIEQIFLLPTTASGGSANAVTPSSFDEETFAITDSGANFIEIWKMNGSSAAPVAHLDTPGFSPANAVWHS